MKVKELYQRNKKGLWVALSLLGLLAFTHLFFRYLFPFIAPFFFGWLLSLLFQPFVVFLYNRFHINRGIGAILSLLLLFAFFTFIVAGILYRLNREATQFLSNLPAYLDNIQGSLAAMQDRLDDFLLLMPQDLKQKLSIQNVDFFALFQLLASGGSQASMKFVMSIPNGIVLAIMTLLSSYFFTKDREQIYTFLRTHLPYDLVHGYALLHADIVGAFTGYIKAQLILMVFTFIICISGLLLLQSPYALLLSCIISVIDALPFFGSGFILWPGALIHLITGSPFLGLGYIIIYLLVTLMRQILQPKILGEQIGLHPLVTLITMYLGLRLMGVLGMIIGPLIAVMVQAGVRIWKKAKVDAAAKKPANG